MQKIYHVDLLGARKLQNRNRLLLEIGVPGLWSSDHFILLLSSRPPVWTAWWRGVLRTEMRTEMSNKCLRLSSLNCRSLQGAWCETKQWTMQFYTLLHHLESETRPGSWLLLCLGRALTPLTLLTHTHSTSITTTAETTAGCGETTSTGGFKLQTSDQGCNIPSLSSYAGGGGGWHIKEPVYLYIYLRYHHTICSSAEYRQGTEWSFASPQASRIRSIILAI